MERPSLTYKASRLLPQEVCPREETWTFKRKLWSIKIIDDQAVAKLIVKPDNANANTDDRSIKCGIAGDESGRRRSWALVALVHLGWLELSSLQYLFYETYF